MINDLKILNGDLELKFNEYTYFYTVKVKDNVNRLEFQYKLNDNIEISIRDNNLNNNNIVYLDVYNINDIDNITTYTFYVYKDKTNLSLGIDNYKKSLEVKEIDNYYNYKVMGLIISCFLFILIIFSIIFRRKKKI